MQRKRWCLLFLLSQFLGCTYAAGEDSSWEDVFPPLGSPKWLFGTGAIERNKPTLDPNPSALSGPASEWQLLQWRKKEYLRPSNLQIQTGRDGTLTYSWQTASKETEIHVSEKTNHYKYLLIGRNGWHDSNGASDLFLSAATSTRNLKANNSLIVNLRARVVLASAVEKRKDAIASGQLLAQAGIIFRTRYWDPEAKKEYSVMVGLPIVNSRNPRPRHLGCHFFNTQRNPQIVAILSPPNQRLLEFRTDSAWTLLQFKLSDVICDIAKQKFKCTNDLGASSQMSLSPGSLNLANWTIDSAAIGVETQAGFRANAGQLDEAGDVKIGLEFSDLRIRRAWKSTVDTCN